MNYSSVSRLYWGIVKKKVSMTLNLCFYVMKFNGLVAWLGMFENRTCTWLRTYTVYKHVRNKVKAPAEGLSLQAKQAHLPHLF